uniref:Endonuclease/exonuclease/phosphatase domain-containing protein n=2 Tax=Caenorhabditis japonica TaxID=281687 RepID=A0A8R1DI38_CAEJA
MFGRSTTDTEITEASYGPKNRRKGNDFHIGSLNVRSISDQSKAEAFDLLAVNSGCKVIALQETKRKEGEWVLSSGAELICTRREAREGGLAFWIHKDWLDSLVETKRESDRISTASFDFHGSHLHVINVYAPTSAANETQSDKFYKDLKKSKSDCNGCPKYGLNINPSKTQILMNKYVTRSDIDILNTRMKSPKKVKYLGRTFADDGSLTEEVARRIRAGWAAFNAIRRELLQSPQKTRIRLLTTTVIPAMTYGCETWTSKEADTKRLQRAVSNMFEIAGCDPPDMEKQVLRRKLKWAGHVSRMKYDRWAKIVSEWDPRGSARPRGRPPKRWADDIKDSIKIFIHNEALRGNLGHGRRRIGILEARRAWSTVGRDRVTWRSLVRSIQDGN